MNIPKDLVSVIVVSLEKGPMLARCLDSIVSQAHKALQCFIFLNKADEKLADEWRASYKGFDFVACPDNELYCRPMNKGIARCDGDFILCLNDDVVLSPDYIKYVLEAMGRDKRIGSVSGCLLREDKVTLDSTGFLWDRSRKPHDRGYGKKMRPAYKKDGYIFGANGAAAFYRRSMLQAIKHNGEYFDERFGFYYEDLDLAWRAHKQGWLAYYCSSAVAYHRRGGTAHSSGDVGPVYRFMRHKAFTRISPELAARLIRNRHAMILKNDRLSRFLIDLPWILFYELRIYLYLLFFRRNVLKQILRHP